MKSKLDYYIIGFKSFIVGLFKFKINDKKIVIDNFLGKGYGDNLKYIVEYLHKKDDSFEFVWIVRNNNIELPDYIKKVKYGTFSSLFEYLTAKLWIDNVRNNIKPKKKKNQVYLQTWHGPFSSKKIEKLAENSLTKEYIKLAKRDGNQTDAILSNSKLQDEQYLHYFWLNKNTEILKFGFPRNDYLINNKNNDALFDEIKEKLKLDKDSMLILYAPTFRDDFDVECYKLDFKKIQKEFSNKYKKKCKILIRLHPNVQKYSNFIKYDDNIIDVTKYPNMQDLSLICGAIISDYSSTLFDFAIQNKPAFICNLDLKKYAETRGLVDEYFKYPFPVSLNSDELINNIKSFNYDDYKTNLLNFFKENSLYDNGDATCKLVEWILNKIK